VVILVILNAFVILAAEVFWSIQDKDFGFIIENKPSKSNRQLKEYSKSRKPYCLMNFLKKKIVRDILHEEITN